MPIIGLVKKASKKASENPNGMLTACPLRVIYLNVKPKLSIAGGRASSLKSESGIYFRIKLIPIFETIF
jgi:hypothetical protein